jgi:hypothetical protein
LRPVRLAYQPPASITFLSEQISHQQSASSTFLSEQISTSHQLNEKVVGVCPQKKSRGLGGPPATTRKLEFACLSGCCHAIATCFASALCSTSKSNSKRLAILALLAKK